MKDGFERREALLKEQENLRNQVTTLDTKLNELKFLYDQYFIGMERTEPLKLREEVRSMIKNLSTIYTKSTAQKFKLNTLIAKHSSYSKLWDRILREIEEGTYKRDIFRIKIKEWQADLKEKKEKGEAKEAEEKAKADPISTLYNQYIESKRKSNEPIDSIKKEKFVETINKQVEEIKKKFKCKAVSFKIVVENGKTKLKATPKN